MKRYKNYWNFLKSTPKNLASVILIWGMAIVALITIYGDNSFDPAWAKDFAIGFIVVVMALGIYRPYTIYKKFK